MASSQNALLTDSVQSSDAEAQQPRQGIVLEFDRLGYVIKGKTILHDVSGRAEGGEMLAVMGPSGAGKSTILDILAKRAHATSGTVTVNGDANPDMRSLASYVEQSDALLGVLTVQETIRFAARLSVDWSTPSSVVHLRVASVISELGLTDVVHNRIGNAVQRGISGGQKRRVTIGSALVAMPRILLLDEPTSGLDSRTSREVLLAIKNVARMHGMLVIASIHQPNWQTISLFDRLLLLAQGRTMYFGPTNRLDVFLAEGLDQPVPKHANPTDHALDIVTTDFIVDPGKRSKHVSVLADKWLAYLSAHPPDRVLECWNSEKGLLLHGRGDHALRHISNGVLDDCYKTALLMERNALNYSRNLLAYGVRLGMYLGMGVLLATVWVNLAQTAAKVNDRLSVHFFSVAFLGFMSVAGIPAFLEERQVFVRERQNGLYGPGPYVLANSIVTLPYLFICALLFAVLCYWSIGLNPGAEQFFRFLGVLFMAVYVAESQSTLVAAVIPIFVAALAIASFWNGFWMCVGGYFIRAVNLPRFWYYWAHFIDYQTYAFDLLVYNDFHGITLDCATESDGSCFCDYPSSLITKGQCSLAGDDVLVALGIRGIDFKLYAVILLLIALFYRTLLYIVLVLKKR
ncbi:P-loop containing nucleoside triphosphate hydrolase protein [Artomyces pyxidatus]|uniref:P-loop containing nucleoside triphosphate hydrolase protein n=1 Tax=Artomyces pyxidatus TaxID=48021 RepID=A0ACB8T0Z3_9AGAM|nr:P-loop containing nucleoside triphosphate hydrolase protein [Artomyces pyxidatus]